MSFKDYVVIADQFSNRGIFEWFRNVSHKHVTSVQIRLPQPIYANAFEIRCIGNSTSEANVICEEFVTRESRFNGRAIFNG